MNIGVNTWLLIENHMTGIGWFISETMQRIVKQHPEHTFYYFFDRQFDSHFITSPNIKPIVVRPKCRYHPIFYKLWYNYMIPHALKKYKIDLFISPDSILPLRTKVPSILVLHDISFERYPDFVHKHMLNYLKKVTRLSSEKAHSIATVSEFSKNDIVNFYNINPNKISIVHSGTKNMFKPLLPEQQESVKREFSDGNDFFIFVGTVHPRKNIKNQLLAFDMFRDANKEARHKFIVVGTKWVWDKDLDTVFSNMKYKDSVIFIGRLSTEKLVKLVASATALMYVSIFEGFGVPILEAFESETPVITAQSSSMPEVAGDAALIVDPFDPKAIFEAMNLIYSDKELAKKLVEKGKEQKLLFSWDITAKKLNAVLTDTIKTITSDKSI